MQPKEFPLGCVQGSNTEVKNKNNLRAYFIVQHVQNLENLILITLVRTVHL